MNYRFEHVHCNVCGADDYEQISTKGKFGFPAHVVICKKCGLSYLNPRWDRDSYFRFYQMEYDSFYRPDLTASLRSDRNVVVERMSTMQGLPVTVRSILDIGSGEGTNLLALGKKYPNSSLFAIEPSQEAQKVLVENGVNMVSDDVDAEWSIDNTSRFDLVVMRHVLEHFMDPLAVMVKVREVLRDEGVIYLAVPNNLKPTQNLETSWFRNVHTYYFNRHSLHNLLSKAGFDIIDLKEGDVHNRGEVFLWARKSTGPVSVTINEAHYREQSDVFRKRLELEGKVSHKVISAAKTLLSGLKKHLC